MKPGHALLLLASLAAGSMTRPLGAQIPVAAESAAARGDTLLVESAILEAIRRNPNDAAARLAFGRWYRRRPTSWMRHRGVEQFREASRLARAQHLPRLVAEAETETGRIQWLEYERFGHAYMLTGTALGLSADRAIEEWRYLEAFFEHEAAPDSSRGEEYYDDAETSARAALAAVPGHVGATELLAVIVGDRGRWEELLSPARAAVRANPRDGRAQRLLALALFKIGRTSDAADAYARALALMDSVQRLAYDNLSVLLRRSDVRRWDSMTTEQRSELSALYWGVAQPLALTGQINELLLEYYSRVTYADLRWSYPEEGITGFETDRGLTWIRYGPPDIWAQIRGGSMAENQVTVAWVYRKSRLRFFFEQMATFARANFAPGFDEYVREVREIIPVRFDNVPVMAALDTIYAQFAQFKGPSGGTTVAVFGFVPIGRMLQGLDLRNADVEVGAIVRDNRMRDVARRVRTDRVNLRDSAQLEMRTWRIDLMPAEYLLRLEARQPGTDRAARSLVGLGVQRFGTDSLQLSDLVVADRVQPRDSNPQRWTDYLIDPSIGRIRSGSPLSLLWETYNLVPDTAGVARYRVEIRIAVRSIERRGAMARIIGGVADAVGVTAQGDTLVTLSFERQTRMQGREAAPTHIDVELGGVPDGTYAIQLTVTDIMTGRSATRRRQFIVTPTPDDLPRRLQD